MAQVVRTSATNVLLSDSTIGHVVVDCPTRYSSTVPHVLKPTVAMR